MITKCSVHVFYIDQPYLFFILISHTIQQILYGILYQFNDIIFGEWLDFKKTYILVIVSSLSEIKKNDKRKTTRNDLSSIVFIYCVQSTEKFNWEFQSWLVGESFCVDYIFHVNAPSFIKCIMDALFALQNTINAVVCWFA